jgi:hypothetical protein
MALMVAASPSSCGLPLAGLLHFLPRQLQPGGVSQQTRLARQLVVVGGAQRQRALQH